MDEDLPLEPDPGDPVQQAQQSQHSVSEGSFIDQLSAQLQNTPIGVILWSVIIFFVLFQYVPFGQAWNLLPKATTAASKPTVVSSGNSKTEAEEEARRKLQERFNAESNAVSSQPSSTKPKSRKLSEKEKRVRKSSAYAYASTGSWSTGRPKAGSNDTSRPSGYQPSFRGRKSGGG